MADVKISTRLDLSKLPSDINEASKLIEKRLDYLTKKSKKKTEEYQKETGIKVTDISGTFGLTQKEIEELNELIVKNNELKSQKLELVKVNEELASSQEKVVQTEAQETPSLAKLVGEIGRLKQEYFSLKEEMEQQGIDINSEEAKAKLDEIQNKLQETKEKIKELYGLDIDINLDNATKNIRLNVEAIREALENIGDGVKKTVKRVLKWGLALLSVRGLYRILSRASNTYLSANEKLSNSLQAAWVGLGTALSGVIEYMIKAIRKAVVSILYFISLLTGVDYIAKANAISLKNQTKATNGLTKATKEANKELASFDEMNILGKTDSGLASGFGSVDTSGLLSLNEISQEAQKNIQKLAEKLKPIYDWFTDPKNKELIKGIGVALGTVFGAAIIGKWVANIGTLLGVFKGGSAAAVAAGGAGSGLLALLGTLALLALDVWLIKIAIEGVDKVVKESKALSNTMDELYGMTKENTTQWKELTDAYVKNALEGKTTEKQNQLIADGLLKNIDNNNVLNKSLEMQKNLAGVLSKGWVDASKSQKLLNDESRDSILKLSQLYNAGKLTTDQIEKYKTAITEEIKRLKENNLLLDKGSEEYKKNSSAIKALEDDLKSISGQKYKVTMETEIKEPKTSAFKNTINNLFKGLASGLGTLGYKINVPKLAVGGVVNRPTYAMIGEAGREAVMPLDRNTEWMNELAKKINANGGTVNVYLDGRLIQRQVSQREDMLNFATNGGM